MRSTASHRLALGTAQFGLDYGVANTSGRVEPHDVASILARARLAGLDTLDTAPLYGSAETVLGAVGVTSWHVISKLPDIPSDCPDASGYVRAAVTGSLDRLGLRTLSALLVHHADQLLGPHGDQIFETLTALKAEGLIAQAGVSVYGPDELAPLFARYALDVVQAPFSAFDRRLERTGWLASLQAAGVEVHVRSVFLQGLLLVPAPRRPRFAAEWAGQFAAWDAWLSETGITAIRACLGAALAEPGIKRIILGVDSLSQLDELLEIAGMPIVSPPSSLATDDEGLINPTRWGNR